MSLRSILRSIWTAGRGVLVGLPEATETSDPFELFGAWLEAAEASGIIEPTAMTLATAGKDGQPSARQVLLKGFDEAGFVFYTSYESQKAREIEENPRAALCFWWPELERQIRVRGSLERVSREESEAYFRTRPRLSQLSAVVSPQSEELASRDALERQLRQLQARYEGQSVPCPGNWGGYRLRPERIGAVHRLSGTLAAVKYNERSEQYRGAASMDHPNLQAVLRGYLQDSQQTLGRAWLHAAFEDGELRFAGGLLVERLPITEGLDSQAFDALMDTFERDDPIARFEAAQLGIMPGGGGSR